MGRERSSGPGARRGWLRGSVLGLVLAALYASAFIAAYVDYRIHAGEWFSDIKLILLAVPFMLPMRAIAGDAFNLTGQDTGMLVAAAVFCSALAFAVGWLVETAARALYRGLRRA